MSFGGWTSGWLESGSAFGHIEASIITIYPKLFTVTSAARRIEPNVTNRYVKVGRNVASEGTLRHLRPLLIDNDWPSW